MDKCLIITSHVENIGELNIDQSYYDTIICADGGLLVADKLNIKADILIGDYDSMLIPKNRNIIKLPMEKDMTDSEAAIDLAVSKGYDFIDILGGLGGRFDHTMGNIGMLAKYCESINHIAMLDGQNYVFMLTPGKHQLIHNTFKYLGVISYGDSITGLNLTGTKYPLKNHTLTNTTSLGVSNEIIESCAEISFNTGKALIVFSKDIN